MQNDHSFLRGHPFHLQSDGELSFFGTHIADVGADQFNLGKSVQHHQFHHRKIAEADLVLPFNRLNERLHFLRRNTFAGMLRIRSASFDGPCRIGGQYSPSHQKVKKFPDRREVHCHGNGRKFPFCQQEFFIPFDLLCRTFQFRFLADPPHKFTQRPFIRAACFGIPPLEIVHIVRVDHKKPLQGNGLWSGMFHRPLCKIEKSRVIRNARSVPVASLRQTKKTPSDCFFPHR